MTTVTENRKGSEGMSWWKIALIISVLASVGCFVVFALPYIMLKPSVLDSYKGRQAWIVIHVITGSIALFTGPVQIWLGMTGKSMKLHRTLGFVYLTAIAVASFTAFYLAVNTDSSWLFGLGLGGLGCAWVISTTLGMIAIRRGKYLQHKEWMIRSYVVTFGFTVFRIYDVVMTVIDYGTPEERLIASSWICWSFPLLFTEAIIQGRKIFDAKE